MKFGRVSAMLAVMTFVAGAAATTACGDADGDGNNGRVASTVKKNPPGNNGTVKIQEAGTVDEIPDNDPHVGCTFQIEFRGFDLGAALQGKWELAVHPPTGTGTVIAGGEVGIGEDLAGGANDLDAVVNVDLGDYDLSGFYQHPQQGYHLKLTVHADGSIGADTKHKVFWVDGCWNHESPDAGTGTGTDAGTGSSGSSGESSSGSSGTSGGSSSGKTW
jgi:uncharacterized membrane protein YgcG